MLITTASSWILHEVLPSSYLDLWVFYGYQKSLLLPISICGPLALSLAVVKGTLYLSLSY